MLIFFMIYFCFVILFFLYCIVFFFFFFFFSSRRRHTRLTCDWSSDVCSSDLNESRCETGANAEYFVSDQKGEQDGSGTNESLRYDNQQVIFAEQRGQRRSEERRVGKECRSRWSP